MITRIKYFFIFIGLLITATGNLFAQINYKHTIDSLKKEMYRNHDPKTNVILQFQISMVCLEMGDYSMSLNYGNKAKIQSQNLGMDTVYLEISEHLGNLFMTQGDYAGAINQFQEELRIIEKTKDKIRIAFIYSNIGTNHWYMGNYDEALKNYKKSYQISEVVDDYDGMAGQLNNIGLIYRKKGDLKTALRYYEQSLNLCKKLNNDKGYANALNNIGIVYQYQKNYEESIKNYEASLEIRKRLNDPIGISTSLGNLGSIYAVKGDYLTAEKYLKEAYAISEEVNDLEGIQEVSFNLADIYEKTGRETEAYAYFKIYIESRDSLNNEENKREAYQKELNFKFETEKLQLAQDREKEEIQNREREKTQKIILFSVIGGSVMIVLFAFFIYLRFRESRKQNKIIEQQKHLVEEKQKEIIDSITYAQRLQNAILTPETEIKKYFKNSFLFYRPKDIVAGDFYFFEVTESHIFYAAADCTGHGVPGALVSIVCSNALTRSVKEFELTDPGKILDKTRDLILETFQKSSEDVKDGMDISLIAINRITNEIKWAGANNPLWYIDKDEVTEIKADKQPIGKSDYPKPFTTHLLSLCATAEAIGGTRSLSALFLFTDGYADQFGGPEGKKFKYANLQKLILEGKNETSEIQKIKLEKEFMKWKGDLEQVDDVCIIGISI